MRRRGQRQLQVVLGINSHSASAGELRDLVPSLGGEDPLDEGAETHSSTLVWRIPWTEEPGGLQSVGSRSQTRLTLISRQPGLYDVQTQVGGAKLLALLLLSHSLDHDAGKD